MAMRVSLGTLLLVSTALTSAQNHGRRESNEISWFPSENGQEDCQNVDEKNPPATISKGRPAWEECKEDETEHCFCFKIGSTETLNWQRRCRKCQSERKWNPCSDGSKPTCDGKEPVCGDGSPFKETGRPCDFRIQGRPKCEDSDVKLLCEDGKEPKGRHGNGRHDSGGGRHGNGDHEHGGGRHGNGKHDSGGGKNGNGKHDWSG